MSTKQLRAGVGVLLISVSALVCGGLWAWSRGLSGPYHFDDYVTPLDDPASQSLAEWRRHLAGTLRPATKLTYALEAETSVTGTPAARRIVSILLHGVSAGLLLLLIRRLAPGVQLLGATLLAVFWFVHPVHADGVLLASGRTTVLSNLFVIASLLAFDRSWRWLAALFFVLACLSRETAIAALLPLAVLALARHRGSWRPAVHELAPALLAGALVVCWILTTPRYLQLAEYSLLGRPFLTSAIGQVGAVPIGLGLLFYPTALSIDYGIPLPIRLTEPLFLLGLLLYGGAAASVFYFLRRSPAAALGLALWLAALLPTQSVIPKLDALANRPLSLALAGLLLAVAPAVAMWSHAFLDKKSRVTHLAAGAVAAAMTVVVLTTSATAHRAELFRSELQLWQDAAAKSRVNERPYVQYAVLLKQEGKNREALEALSAAAKINPFSSQVSTLTRFFGRKEVSR